MSAQRGGEADAGGGLRFGVLGALEVTRGGEPVALGGPKQRAVLVALLLSANRVVTAERLAEELWGDSPPAQSGNVLQSYISTLRRALEPGRAPREPARVLRSQAPGYLLEVDLGDVDALRFEQLAGEGRALVRDGRFAQAAEELRAALGLWRGPALAEFEDLPLARSEAARLEELRLAALESRIEADLALGEHAAVIGELYRLVEAEPLREQPWAQLMVALYRAGRQGDALAAYRDCRTRLAEQLGIEPGAALRQLEIDVLRQAKTLDWHPVGEPADTRAGVPFLSYRDERGSERVHALEPSASPVLVGRAPSAALALHWDERVSRAHARLERHGDTWLVVDDGMSRNGSFVNDERVEGERLLADGDVLRFGETVLTYRSPAAPAIAETVLADP